MGGDRASRDEQKGKTKLKSESPFTTQNAEKEQKSHSQRRKPGWGAE
jgi:hypothetical protein